ncbi:hypothetical protein Scep_029756 [Stephania cephalantha]|uniref:Uncharacterized protein n=1 Tax=Stephania cephalantha TaxID=152367 RepID=A0AAP0E193_9MAGN
MAKLFDSKFADARKTLFHNKNPTLSLKHPSNPQAPAPQPSTTAPAAIPVRRLSETEMQKLCSKGLCFNCDDKYTPGHLCKSKQFLLFLDTNSDTASNPHYTPDPIDLPDPPPAVLIIHPLTIQHTLMKQFISISQPPRLLVLSTPTPSDSKADRGHNFIYPGRQRELSQHPPTTPSYPSTFTNHPHSRVLGYGGEWCINSLLGYLS